MKNDGVTLIELAVVIVIIGIIILLTTVDVSWLMRDTRVTDERDRILADIEEAKLRSVTEVPHAIFVVGTTSTNYTLRRLNITDDNFKKDTGDAISIVSGRNLTSKVKVAYTNSGGELWFDRKGMPKNSNWEPITGIFRLWYDADNNNVIDIDEENTVKNITISSAGRIQYEKR